MTGRNIIPVIGLTIGGALAALGQTHVTVSDAPSTGNVIHFQADHSAGSATAGTHVMSNTFEFVRGEFGSNSVVKGAPYTAEAVTESIQTLPDGNRIVHKDSTTLARDTEGRTRRDLSVPAIPGMDPADVPKFSMIWDAATNISFTLDHNTRTARKSGGRGFNIQLDSQRTKVAGVGGRTEAHELAITTSEAVVAHTGAVAGGMVSATRPAGAARVMVMESKGGPMVVNMNGGGVGGELQTVTSNLGKQNIEGVQAEGTRSVTTIPAGQMGNERPIEIVSERWYSPELQMVVLTKHNDPRSGETIYRVSNLRRGEPAKSLFEVPADYTVKSGDGPAEPMKIRMIRPPQE